MSLEPFDWNVVIIGRWNISILTPGRVAEKILGLQPLQGATFVDVPLDGLSPYRIKDPQQEIMFIPENNQLVIRIIKMDYTIMEKALQYGLKVLAWLPETPISAAGFNIRFKSSDATPELIDIFRSSIDSKLGSIGYTQISNRTITRIINYKNGVLNLMITQDSTSFALLFNFHLGSNDNNALQEWLRQPVSEIEEIVQKITNVLGFEIGGANNDNEGP